MSYITFQQMETGRVLGMPYDAIGKEKCLENMLQGCITDDDMLQMLDDLPLEAFVLHKADLKRIEVIFDPWD